MPSALHWLSLLLRPTGQQQNPRPIGGNVAVTARVRHGQVPGLARSLGQ